jgi:oxygen-independent coproporphyrinogen-3 oxidase
LGVPDGLGVYVHFPWCRARCPYCDFAIAIAPLADIPHARYADQVLAELDARAPRFAALPLVSIYFGGGTPALWRADEIARVRAAVEARFGGAAREITVEANPNDCRPAILDPLRAAGVTRLSIGAQSFGDENLVLLGRDHDAAAATGALAAARAAGFAEVSLDLIYALPGRDLADWHAALDQAVALGPEHLSVYQLTIEPRTSFGQAARTGRLVPVPDDDAAAQFEAAHDRLGGAGYEHYEVSSYARPGHRAVHNARYWIGAPYLGLGNGAHSFFTDGARGVRWSAHRSVVRYLAGRPDPDLALDGCIAEVQEDDAAALAADRLWLGMRTSDGVARRLVDESTLPPLVAAGLVVVEPDRVRPTARGLLFADEIGARLRGRPAC